MFLLRVYKTRIKKEKLNTSHFIESWLTAVEKPTVHIVNGLKKGPIALTVFSWKNQPHHISPAENIEQREVKKELM